MSCISAFYLAVGAVTVGAAPRGDLPLGPLQAAAAEDPDALYAARLDPAKAKQAAEIWQRRAADGKDYEASWKLARACYYLATQGPKDNQDAELDRGMAAGKQAAAIDGTKPDGHFWWAATMGEKAQRGGMMAGLKYKSDIRSELEKVIAIQPGWQSGSAESALAQWYLKVPDSFICCGGDRKKGIDLLRKALTYDPNSSQAKYSLAEALAGNERTRAEAKTLLAQVIAAPLDPDWVAEDQFFKAKARTLLDKLNGKTSQP